jgi:DNA-binding CsgD family transcriptional regulator
VDAAAYDADLTRIRSGMTDGEFEKSWAEGKALSLEEAVIYASRGRGRRTRPTFGWSSLTPTEVEVVRYVAQGLTNPQIAEKMFISRSTVKVHLAHVFTKLGITRRAELASEATRRSLQPRG